MHHEKFVLGSIWRANDSVSALDEIRIVSPTDNPRVWLVEWTSNGRHIRMVGAYIRTDYTLG